MAADRPPLIPRFGGEGYEPEDVGARRDWVAGRCGARLDLVGRHAVDPTTWRGNVENPIGAAQVPLGVAGPLLVHGEHARGVFYVPLATTEGALVRSYERGMMAITRCGGARVRIWGEGNRVTPVFEYRDLEAVSAAVAVLGALERELAAAAESTTRHGHWAGVTPRVVGRRVMLEMRFRTGDAQGMNMIVKAADAAARVFAGATGTERWWIFSGHGSEKRASGSLLAGGKGRRVTATVELPAREVRLRFRVSPEEMAELWRRTVVGHLEAGALGYNGQYANGLAALFIACGQDVANVVDSSIGITELETTDDGNLFASANLHALSVATVGGGTGVGTAAECLGLLGCVGSGKAAQLAEIVAATLLAGELSMAAAIASGDFVAAHEEYGRNRPPEPEPEPGSCSERLHTAERPNRSDASGSGGGVPCPPEGGEGSRE